MIVNWPQGIVRDRDKGVAGLSAEDANKLHDALFVDEQQLQFVPCGEGRFFSIYRDHSTVAQPATRICI